MYRTTTTEQGSQVAESSLGHQPQRPSAVAPKAEPCLRPPHPGAERRRPEAHSHRRAAFEFGGRAGFQARHIKVARSAFRCAVSVAASIRVSVTRNTRPTPSRSSNLGPPTSSFYSSQWTSRTHSKGRAISNLVFSTRHKSRRCPIQATLKPRTLRSKDLSYITWNVRSKEEIAEARIRRDARASDIIASTLTFSERFLCCKHQSCSNRSR